MEAPFVYGRIAQEDNFTDRIDETNHLVQNFCSLVNTIIVSPRRWGKSSLVSKSAIIAQEREKDLKVCQIDLFNVRDEDQFYQILAQGVIQALSSRWDEAVDNAKRFLSSIVPKVSIGNMPENEISLSFDRVRLKDRPDEVLDLAEKLSKEKGLRLVVCIDEFQNISNFADLLYFQRRLRSHWQRHQNVAYCLYGSKRHMMTEIFTNAQMPFYKFGDIFFLDKIKDEYFIDFIAERFIATGKNIDIRACRKIIDLTDNHPYYVQQLSQLSWFRTPEGTVCGEDIVSSAHAALVNQLSLVFESVVETLTSQQLALLKAIVHGEKAFTSRKVMLAYSISSPVAFSRSRKSLIERDILDNLSGVLKFQDPIFAYWLAHYYFV